MKYLRLAEWYNNKTICLAWPYDINLWRDELILAQGEFIDLIKALENEKIIVLVPNEREKINFLQITGFKQKIVVISYADIWIRDTLPIMVKNEIDQDIAVIPRFNGWGKKYFFDEDKTLAKRFSKRLLLSNLYSPLVMEGGAIECDGQGTLITTESCLLNKNRNPGLKRHEIEYELSRIFGAKKVIWLKEGLFNDHTDGHVDTLARFIAPNKIAIMVPYSMLDPNYQSLVNIREVLSKEIDVLGNSLELIELPSPGLIKNSQGEIMPASYLNFIIGNEAIYMPLFGSKYDDDAIYTLEKHSSLPVRGLSAKAILSGGGAFHCLSQELFDI